MHIKKIVSGLVAGVALAASLTACGYDAYDDGYSPAYVVGRYTCVNPNSGQPDYCVEYSDGTSEMVPFGIYNTAYYGTVLTYSHSRWITTRTSYYSHRTASDVYHVTYRTYHARTGGYTASGYGGMSYRSRAGRVIYRSGSSYRSSSYSFRSTSRGRF
jgi:hypothetical protein